MARAPIDCTSSRSKTGLNVVPPFTDFQTPPLAAPTKSVTCPLSSTPVTAAIRPLIAAEPILRAGKPEIVAESNLNTSCPNPETADKSTPNKESIIFKVIAPDERVVIFSVLNKECLFLGGIALQ